MAMPARVSLAQLLDAPIDLTAADAVAVIVQLARSPQVGRPLPLQLDPSHVWLEASGAVTLSPGLVPRLGEFAALLMRLLSPIGDAVPRALLTIVDRAAIHGATAAVPTLSAFAAALAPFQPADPAATVSALVGSLAGPRRAAPLPTAAAPVAASVPRVAAAVPPAAAAVPAVAASVPPVAPVSAVVVPAAAKAVPAAQRPPTPPQPASVLVHPAAQPHTPARPLPVASPVPARTEPLPVPAPAARRRDEGRGWRPAPWHVGGALAATLLAAMLGGSLARSRNGSELSAASQAPAARPTSTTAANVQRRPAPEPEMEALPREDGSPQEAPVPPATLPAPEPPPPPMTAAETPEPERAAETPAPAPDPSDTQPDVLTAAGDPPAPAPEPPPVAPTTGDRGAVEPPVARPARLVDRRDVQADAVFSPSFATNGSAVFFHAESAGGSALKRADAGGGELRVASIVDDGARNYHVQVSPDGRQVAFDSDRDGVRGVYVADAQGRDVRRVSGPGYAAVPTWSPDGRRLAFIRAEPNRPAVWNLWLLDRESGRQARVTSYRRGQVWGGAWFADGRRLAYSHEDRLILHDLASGRVRGVASPLAGRLVRTPAVSPDGRWIIFQVYRDGVWLFDVEGGGMQRVLDDPSAEEFAWSPDGRRVAYHSRRSGGWNLWTMTVR